MLLRELTQKTNEKQVWARSGQKVVRKYRCLSGRRQGRVVAKMSQCYAPLDIKKKAKLRQTKARFGSRIIRKSKRTKRLNPASKRVRSLNKASRRR